MNGDTSSASINTGEVKRQLKEQGRVRLSSVLNKEEAAHILDRLWNAKKNADAKRDQSYLEHLEPNPSDIRIFGLLELNPVFRELITHPKVIELVKFILGKDFIISNYTNSSIKGIE